MTKPLICFTAVVVLLAALFSYWYLVDRTFFSVEFGLAELSPRGEKGGYAMPASGASAPSGLHHSCSYEGTSVTLQWNPSSSTYAPQDPSFADLFDFLQVKEAYAFGGGNPPADTSGGSFHSPHPVTYNVAVYNSGGSAIYSQNDTSSNSVSLSIGPAESYSWRVQACAGGGCSDWQSSSFSCPPPPPTVDLNANPGTVRYNNSSTLEWTSTRATSCTAGGAWSGVKGPSGSESTGPLRSSTTYNMSCHSNLNGWSTPDSATVNVTSCVAGAKVSVSQNTVRKGGEVTITYNTGAANPSQCVLRVGALELVGDLENNGDTSSSCSDGSNSPNRTYKYVVNGESEIVWECEGQVIDKVLIKVLPEFQET